MLFWSKSSVKELKSHLLLFCLSAVLFVLQCLSAYVHNINIHRGYGTWK